VAEAYVEEGGVNRTSQRGDGELAGPGGGVLSRPRELKLG